jgi:ketosteroid isomerase-like protein
MALLLVSGCGGSATGTEAVKDLVRREAAAVNARDMQALSQIWSQSDDILLFDVAPPGRFQGWPAIAKTFNEFFLRLSDVSMGVDNLQVQADESLAAATYDWTLTGTLDGQRLEDHGRATALYRREKDGWHLVHAHFSPAPRGAVPAGDQTEKPAAPPEKGAP